MKFYHVKQWYHRTLNIVYVNFLSGHRYKSNCQKFEQGHEEVFSGSFRRIHDHLCFGCFHWQTKH